MPEPVVVDASAIVDLLVGTRPAAAVRERLDDTFWHAPAHLDVEILSALGRLARAGHLGDADVEAHLQLVGSMPVERHPLPDLLEGAWALRADVRLADGLYLALAQRVDAPLITTDRRLARTSPLAELVVA